MTPAGRAIRNSSHDGRSSWWRREYGGLPGWALAGMLAAILGTGAFSLVIVSIT